MEILCVDPRTDPLWQKLLQRHRSSVFHCPAWIRVLNDTYGLTIDASIILDSAKEPIAGVPFCRVTDITGKRIVCLPFSDYCDPLVSSADEWWLLSSALLSLECPVQMRCLHSELPLGDGRLTVMKQAKWHYIDLQPDVESVWQGLHESSRRAIRKAQRDMVTVQTAKSEQDLRAFYDMHLLIRKQKYRLLAQPYRFFESIWRHFVEAGNGTLMLAVYQGNVIGGTFFLEWNDTLYYKFNASVPDHLDHRPNDLLIWEGIQYGKSKSYKSFDFGLSDWDEEGLVRYKRKFATGEKTISFLRHDARQALSSQERQARELLPALTQLFTEETVHDHVTEKAGDLLYRFFA